MWSLAIICLAGFRHIRMKYDIDVVLLVGLIKQIFYDYAFIS